MGLISNVLERISRQVCSNAGFEAGKAGKAPQAALFSEEGRKSYEKGYDLGAQAAKTNLVNTVSRKIEDL